MVGVSGEGGLGVRGGGGGGSGEVEKVIFRLVRMTTFCCSLAGSMGLTFSVASPVIHFLL